MGEKESGSGVLGKLIGAVGLTPGQANLLKLAAVGLAVGVLFLQADSLFGVSTNSGGDRPPGSTLVSAAPAEGDDELARAERKLATDLEEMLALVDGAGRVRVKVTLAGGPTIEVAKNTQVNQSTTTEKAADDSNRQTQTTDTRTDHVFQRDGNTERPVIAHQTRPEIAGVLVVADGARQAAIRARLLQAVVTSLRIPANRVDVIPASGG